METFDKRSKIKLDDALPPETIAVIERIQFLDITEAGQDGSDVIVTVIVNGDRNITSSKQKQNFTVTAMGTIVLSATVGILFGIEVALTYPKFAQLLSTLINVMLEVI